MDNKITLTISELEKLLADQKTIVANHITRNLSVYTWYMDRNKPIDLEQAKTELANECHKADYPNDFIVLKKYLNH